MYQSHEMSHFALTILHNKNYSHLSSSGNRETWYEIATRVAGNVVKPYMPHLWERIRDMIAERKFIPGGRYLYASGRRYHQVNSCFLFRAEDNRDEEGGWAETMRDCTSSLMTGGGIGVVYSRLREEGRIIHGMGGHSTGPCALMAMVNEAGRYIIQGGSRRSAIWAGLHWNHPDVFKFICLKDWPEDVVACKSRNFSFPAPMDGTNISVILDTEFFYAYNQPAHPQHGLSHEVYDTVVRHMLETGEPGFSVNVDDMDGEDLRNACLTGDTLVGVADGRGAVPIKNLVGKSTRIYSSDYFGNVRVGTLKDVRRTRKQAEIVCITLDDGSSVRLTADHQVMMYNGGFVEAGSLIPGVKLMPFSSSVNQGYRWVGCGSKRQKQCWLAMGREHGMDDGCDVHHINGDSLDDSLDNLELLEHGKHAAVKMIGDNNPTRRLEHDKEWRIRKSIASTGSRNGRYIDGRKEHTREMSDLHDTVSKKRTWKKVCAYCKDEFQTTRSAVVVCSKECSGKIRNRKKVSYRGGRRVVSVVLCGREDVYCGSVEGLESFAVVTTPDPDTKHGHYAGMIVHNCTEVSSRTNRDMCNLGSANMSRIATKEEFAEVVELGTLFLLCGTLYSKLPVDAMYKVREKNRRLGLGLMGVHEWLLTRGRKYGPDDELCEWMQVYTMSGSFANRYADKLGISRPIATRSIAPTGTISIVAETTSGIEPVFAVAQKRRYLEGKTWKAQYIVDATAKRLIDEKGVDPALIEDSYTLAEDVERRIQFQSWMQRDVDHSVSSTVNLPRWGSSINNESTVSSFGKTLMKYLPRLRGITAYPDGARGGQPLNRVPYTDAIMRLGKTIVESSEVLVEPTEGLTCKEGSCNE